MRIRKRLSGCLPKQLPSYKYCFSTGWLRPHEARHNLNTNTNITNTRCEGECKSREHPIHGGGEAIGEDEPRTPPPCYGEKPAIPRHLRHDNELLRHEHEQELAPHLSSKKAKRRRSRDQVKGESSSISQRKRVRVQNQDHHQQQQQQLHLRDPAEPPNKRSSHENCGPQPRLDPNEESFGEKSISYQQEISKMDPLLRAMHMVVSEAGIEGLTARETAQRIITRGLCSEGDIPRSVKMAKAMRESPYLVEISRSSKFVLWSTFLEESSRSLAGQSAGGGAGAGAGEAQACRRRRRQRPGNNSEMINRSNTGINELDPSVDEAGVAFQMLELRMGSSAPSPLRENHQLLQVNGVIKPSSPIKNSSTTPTPAAAAAAEIKTSSPPAPEPRKFFLDLNMAPQDDW